MSLVCWSGGADSTLVLYDLLREERSRSKTGAARKVRTISIVHDQLGANRQQREARRRIRAALEKRNLRFDHVEVKLSDKGDFYVEKHGATQAALWLGTAVPYLRKNEKLYVGYVGGDCIWSYWSYLHGMFSNAATILGIEDASLETPLYGVRKVEVYARLRKARLVGLTWTCETPTKAGKACGRCRPCRTKALARYEARRWPGVEEKG